MPVLLMSMFRRRLARATGIQQVKLRLDQLERGRTADDHELTTLMAHLAAMHTDRLRGADRATRSCRGYRGAR